MLAISCTQKTANLVKFVEKNAEKKTDFASQKQEFEIKKKNDIVKKEADFSKVLREAIYFSSNLEREALRLISKNNSLQKVTLFSILSYIVETNAGVKKPTPFGLDCNKFNIQRESKLIKISKSCVKPSVEVVQIKTLEKENLSEGLYEVEFFIKEWERVVGMSVTLTGDNMRCQLKIKDKKLYRLKCDNWSYQMEAGQASLTVVKAKQFLFQRDAQKQFVIQGGFFKEMMENRKIDISVPLQGKIKIFEKEIKILDQFAEELNRAELNEPNKVQNEEKGVKNHEEKAENKNEVDEKINQIGNEVQNKDVSQEGGQESSQEVHQEISQDNAQGEVVNEVQTPENQPETQPETQNINQQNLPSEGEIDFGAEVEQQQPSTPARGRRGRQGR